MGDQEEIGDPPILEFAAPMPGFPSLIRFVLVQLVGEDSMIFELRSTDNPDVRFLVANPAAFFPDYGVELTEESCADLGLSDAGDALVFVVLTIGDDLATTTANLMAPVVVNTRTRSAAQVILAGTQWPLRAALV